MIISKVNDAYQTFARKICFGRRPFPVICQNCLYLYIVHSNLGSPISLYNAIQWQPSQLKGLTLTTFTDNYTNFLFDCLLLLHGNTLCNIGKLVVSWCVCVCVCPCFFFFLKKIPQISVELHFRNLSSLIVSTAT